MRTVYNKCRRDKTPKKFGISVCPYYVCTEEGRFLDEQEVKADELLLHMAEGRKGYSQPPDVEDLWGECSILPLQAALHGLALPDIR